MNKPTETTVKTEASSSKKAAPKKVAPKKAPVQENSKLTQKVEPKEATPKVAKTDKATEKVVKAPKVAKATKVEITGDMSPAEIKKAVRRLPSLEKTEGKPDGRKVGDFSLHRYKEEGADHGAWGIKLNGKWVVENTRYHKANRLLKALFHGIVKPGTPEAKAIIA